MTEQLTVQQPLSVTVKEGRYSTRLHAPSGRDPKVARALDHGARSHDLPHCPATAARRLLRVN